MTVALPLSARSLGFRRCYRRPNTFHGVGNIECDCLRVEIPVEARASSCGRLLALHPVALHQSGCGAGSEPCGGDFECEGCKRLVGWCMGSGDELGAEHCDDCWVERRGLLAFLADSPCSLTKLERRFGSLKWRQSVADILESLRDDKFIKGRDACGRYRLTPLGKEALQ